MQSFPLRDSIIQTIGDLADAHGIAVYVVGGYVRDTLRGGARKDIDCTVIGDALAFATIVAERFRSKPVIYERFRTALVPVGDYQLEFVGTRKEEYVSHSRNPIVREGTLDDDLRRRDFTVNAMAVAITQTNPRHRYGELIDMFGGIEDIDKKVLRTPLDPTITFSDDPLRMMRAARFSAQLQFDIDPATLSAIRPLRDRISIISQERITDEFLKILRTQKPSIGLNILYTTGLMERIFPEVHRLAGVDLMQAEGRMYRHKDVFYHTLQVVDNSAEVREDVWFRYAALVHDIAKPKTKRFTPGIGWSFHGHEEVGARWQDRIFRSMKFSHERLDYVKTLVRLHQRPMQLVSEDITDSAIRRIIVQAGPALEDLFALCRADITSKQPHRVVRYMQNYDIVYQKVLDVREKDRLYAFQSPVRGEEIMQICSLEPSRAVGYIKTMIEEAILDGVIPNDYDAAKAYMLLHKDTWISASATQRKTKHALVQEFLHDTKGQSSSHTAS